MATTVRYRSLVGAAKHLGVDNAMIDGEIFLNEAGLSEDIQPDDRIQFSQKLPGDGMAIVEVIDKAGIEGMVSKRRDSCRGGRLTNWLKIESYVIDEYELLGVERGMGNPAFALMADRRGGEFFQRLNVTVIGGGVSRISLALLAVKVEPLRQVGDGKGPAPFVFHNCESASPRIVSRSRLHARL